MLMTNEDIQIGSQLEMSMLLFFVFYVLFFCFFRFFFCFLSLDHIPLVSPSSRIVRNNINEPALAIEMLIVFLYLFVYWECVRFFSPSSSSAGRSVKLTKKSLNCLYLVSIMTLNAHTQSGCERWCFIVCISLNNWMLSFVAVVLVMVMVCVFPCVFFSLPYFHFAFNDHNS